MGYIYLIINIINNKKYVGKTLKTIEERFNEHKKASTKDRCKDFPLYRAFRKYGTENFKIEVLEEVEDPLSLSDREIYWIKELDTYNNGYNATLGGDGKPQLDYNKIIEVYLEKQNITDTAKECDCSRDSVEDILKYNNIEIKTHQEISKEKFSKQIAQYTKDGKLVKIFDSIKDASRNFGPNINGQAIHITDVANGRRKSAYGYIWAWA